MAQKTFTTGEVLTAADVNTYLAGEGGAWTSWTPAVTQVGSVSVTNTRSTYARFGRLIVASLNLAVTGSGTAANSVLISLPVTAASATAGAIGSGVIKDSSASNARYGGVALLSTTTSFLLISTNGGVASPGALGSVDFTAGLASGDDITAMIIYEAAT